MLSFAATRIFLVVGPTDMRKAYDTLATIVRHELKKDPLSGQLFVFANRKHNRLKILVWDRGGFWLCSRRLEKGTFAWPSAGTPYVEMRREELALLLGGVDVSHMRWRPWYETAQEQDEFLYKIK